MRLLLMNEAFLLPGDVGVEGSLGEGVLVEEFEVNLQISTWGICGEKTLRRKIFGEKKGEKPLWRKNLGEKKWRTAKMAKIFG